MRLPILLRLLGVLFCYAGLIGSAMADGQEEPIPSYYEEPGLSRTRDYTEHHANERIDPFTGKLQWHFVDLFIPGNGGMDLKVTRSYTSPYVPTTGTTWEPNLTGLGWTIHGGRVLRKSTNLICDTINGPETNPVLELPDGSRQELYVALDGGSWISTAFWKAECNLTSPGGLIVYSPDGTRYEMSTAGHVVGLVHTQNTYYATKVTDRNGNWIRYSYQFIGGLLALTGATAGSTDPATGLETADGRSLTFKYEGNVLKSITDQSNREWTYTYSAGPGSGYAYLKEVIRPDGGRWLYEYHETAGGVPGAYTMRKITYPAGGTIEYTYDFIYFAQSTTIPRSTVVKQKVANPGGTWTWTYTPATKALTPNAEGGYDFTIPPSGVQDGAIDVTTISGPNEYKSYYHAGYNSVFPGVVYTLGALLGTLNDYQAEGYNRTPMQISNQTHVRPGFNNAFDAAASTPLITSYAVARFGESYYTDYFDFDTYGNPQTIVEIGNRTRTTAVTYFTNPTKWIIRGVKKDETVTEGTEILTTTRSFDDNANLKTHTRAGVTTSYTYTTSGDISTRTDPRLKTTTYLDYYRGIPRTENQPEGVTVTRTVNLAGDITSETDGELAATHYEYDQINRITKITHPAGNPVTVDWTVNTRTVNRGAYRELTTYDGFNREISRQLTDTATNETITQTFQVDSLGRRTYASYPNASKGTGYEYDMLNRLITVYNEYTLPSIFVPFPTWTSYRLYDYYSDLISIFNERGFTYQYLYRSYGDPDNRDLIGIVDPLSGIENTSIERNIAGQMTSITQDNVTRLFGYDTRFYLTSITDPETGLTDMGRDANGNMTTRKVGSSGITSYTYDDRNRVTFIDYPAGTPDVTRQYYKDDTAKLIDNGTAKRDYLYDANKNLKTETLTVGAKRFETQYGYDGNDALASVTYGSGQVVDYAPDAFARPRKAGAYVTYADYHPNGTPKTLTYANGVQNTFSINGRQWPSSVKVTKGSDYFNMSYLYDPVGNVSSITDSVDSAYSRTMTYDSLDRLSTVSGPWGSGSISLDLRGNIKSQTFGTYSLTYTYDTATQRLQSVGGSTSRTLSYDAYGNVTNNGQMSFVYNDDATLRCAKCGQAGEITYDYDGANQRVRVQSNGAATYFVIGRDGQLLWEESPTAIKEYIYLGGKQIATREQALP